MEIKYYSKILEYSLLLEGSVYTHLDFLLRFTKITKKEKNGHKKLKELFVLTGQETYEYHNYLFSIPCSLSYDTMGF